MKLNDVVHKNIHKLHLNELNFASEVTVTLLLK